MTRYAFDLLACPLEAVLALAAARCCTSRSPCMILLKSVARWTSLSCSSDTGKPSVCALNGSHFASSLSVTLFFELFSFDVLL